MAPKYSPDIPGGLAPTEHAASSDTDKSETSADRSLTTWIKRARILTYTPVPHHLPRSHDDHYLHCYTGC